MARLRIRICSSSSFASVSPSTFQEPTATPSVHGRSRPPRKSGTPSSCSTSPLLLLVVELILVL
eukprot:2873901-Pyramimonas_sp.AAC.1